MLRMRIYLIRHGQTDWNAEARIQGREDVPLNASGVLQAHRCGAALAGIRPARMITSPLFRARETARIIAAHIGFPEADIIADPGMIEREFGELSGMQIPSRDIYSIPESAAGLEAFDELCARVMSTLERNVDCGGDLLAVSHGGSINAVLTTISRGEYGHGKTRLKNACINVIEYENGCFNVLEYNLAPEEYAEKRGIELPHE